MRSMPMPAPGSGCVPDADPVAARSPAAIAAFGLWLRWYCARNFHAVRLSRTGLPPDLAGRPLIICANHPSWWDPALFILVSRALLRDRIGYGPMDQAGLAKYRFFRRLGVFGIAPDTPQGAARFLQLGTRLLADRRTALWVTAEGHFTDPRRRPVRLRPGVAHLARRVPGAAILPLAIELAFWNERRPEALLRFGAPIPTGPERSVTEWTGLLEAALTGTMDALAAESMARDPGLFLALVRGRSGVGGVYDLWRHAAALARGQHFDASHQGSEW